MSEPNSAPREWPPVDLIAGLSLKTIAEPELELDENVLLVLLKEKTGEGLSKALSIIRCTDPLSGFQQFIDESHAAKKPFLSSNILREISGGNWKLPPETKILEITPSGASAWVRTVRIRTCQKDGSAKDYFKKSQSGSVGRRMMLGTFASERAFHEYAPQNIPKPIAWGNYKSDEDMWFYLAEYHDMVDELPDPQQFVSIIAKIHRDSKGKSPTGKFGFDVHTHLANIPIDNGWEDTWEKFFSKAMNSMFEIEALSQGKNDIEFEDLKEKLLTKVIPRLLRPLESGGRKVTPCLIHSDLWPGNCMIDADTDDIMIFDSCAYWGHNESDLGSWRAPRYRMGKPFIREYQRRVGVSYPEDDWDDRIALYPMRYDILVSALFPNSDKFRNLARDEMKRLSDKYPNGFDDFKEVVPQESSPPTLVFHAKPEVPEVNNRDWEIQTGKPELSRFSNTIKA